MRIHPAAAEEPLIERLCDEHYAWQASSRAGAPLFVLHDGPPYANGPLHMGHLLNKVLKDTILRAKLLRGYRVHFRPGWDCHGLPIELKALELARERREAVPDAAATRAAAAQCAADTIAIQRSSFKRWGVMGDWERPYLTMSPEYEAAQLEVFRRMVRRDLIFRGERPVHWSPASRTALAEAELEYVDDHVSTAAYVGFGLRAGARASAGARALLEGGGGAAPIAAIWTTTPWTLPANQAVCVGADLTYTLAAAASSERYIVAEPRREALAEALGTPLEAIGSVVGSELEGCVCVHPLSAREVPILFGGHVSADAGTGLVHTAPAHGLDDFSVCQENGLLETACPVDADGRFTDEGDAAPFAGLFLSLTPFFPYVTPHSYHMTPLNF